MGLPRYAENHEVFCHVRQDKMAFLEVIFRDCFLATLNHCSNLRRFIIFYATKSSRNFLGLGENPWAEVALYPFQATSTAVKRPRRFSFYLVGSYLTLSENMGKDVQNSLCNY